MAELAGQDVGRYHVIEQLGQGGMASVYKAFDTRLEREVALKVIRKEAIGTANSGDVLKRFEREAKALAQLSHPNIVSVFDYGEFEGSPYIVMEYMTGGTLKDKTDRAMSCAEAARLLLPIARALDYAHKRKLIHRDVKPANILVDSSDNPKLSDFGIAKILESKEAISLTGTGVGIGTPEYMAPEQGMGKEVDNRTDIYSLGIVFYELVTGRKPYSADTPMAVVVKHINDPLPRPRSIAKNLPAEVEQILFKALAKKPEDRYQSMAEFSTALEKLIAPDSTESDVTRSMDDAATQVGEQATIAAPPPPPPPPGVYEKPGAQSPFLQAPSKDGVAPVTPAKTPDAAAQPQKEGRKNLWLGCGIGLVVLLCIVSVFIGSGLVLSSNGSNPIAQLFATSTPTKTLTPTPDIPATQEAATAEVRAAAAAATQTSGAETMAAETARAQTIEARDRNMKTDIAETKEASTEIASEGTAIIQATIEYERNQPVYSYIPLIDATVIEVNFYESGDGVLPLDERVYQTSFPKSTTRYVNIELYVEYIDLSHDQSIEYRYVTYLLDGDAPTYEQTWTTEAGYESYYFYTGYGWDDSGNWEVGNYQMDIFIQDEKVASGAFSIY